MTAIKACTLASALGMVILWISVPAAAQSGGPYALNWNTIDGGGATFSTGGQYILGGTVGQPDAGMSSGSVMIITGGFWAGVLPPPSATPTPTLTATANRTATLTPTSTRTITRSPTLTATATTTSIHTPVQTPTTTRTPSPTASVTQSPRSTATPSSTPSPTSTNPATATPTASATPSATSTPGCVGDCRGDHQVTVDEILTLVNIALGNAAVAGCRAGDANHDGQITIDEILTAVNNALNGCSGNMALSFSPPVSLLLRSRN